MTAVMQFRGENIDLLLKYGADVNAHDKFGASAPNTASDLGRFDIVARFLEALRDSAAIWRSWLRQFRAAQYHRTRMPSAGRTKYSKCWNSEA